MHKGNITKEKVLLAALKLFADEGFEKVSLEAIARQVGIKKASLFYFFKSKEDILLAVLEAHWLKFEHKLYTDFPLKPLSLKSLEKLLTLALEYMSTLGSLHHWPLMASIKDGHKVAICEQVGRVQGYVLQLFQKTKISDSKTALEIIEGAIKVYGITARHNMHSSSQKKFISILAKVIYTLRKK